MYRPQFAFFPPPTGCQDEPCQYSFDTTNCPTFSGTLAAGTATPRIPLKLDKDAPFLLRAIRSQGGVSFRLEDPDGNPLSDSENITVGMNYELPSEYARTDGAGLAVLESGAGGVFAPAGANFLGYLYNAGSSGIDLTTCAVNLFGVKRHDAEACP
jgi:hypothetical protein